jgi:purine-nucleoside phosphorylase
MTIETYAEILQKRKEEKMSNYDMDEIERERDRNAFASVKIGNEESEAVVTVELPDDVILRLSLQAHERDITLNKMCGIALKDSLKNLEYRYEHQSKPQVLKEY